MRGVLVIAHLTWMEARRRRIALAAVLCGLLFLAAYGTALYFLQRNAPHVAGPPPFMRQAQQVFITLAEVILNAIGTFTGAASSFNDAMPRSG